MQVRPTVVNSNSNERLFISFISLQYYKSGSYNDTDNLYNKLCVTDVAKEKNIKVFSLTSRTNEARYISWHETCAFTFTFTYVDQLQVLLMIDSSGITMNKYVNAKN